VLTGASYTEASYAELSLLLRTLQAEVVASKVAIAELVAANASLRETVVNLSHENALLKRRIYGNKTEKLRTSELQLTLGSLLTMEEKLQAELDEAVGKAESDAGENKPPDAPKDKAKPKGRRDLSTSTLPRVPLEILDATLEKTAKRIGFEESLQLMYRRGGFAVLVKRTAKYLVARPEGAPVVGVPTPKSIFRKGLLHTSAVAHILVQKFALGVPHYRLEQHLKPQGMDLDRSLMSRYAEEAGNTLGATVVHAMWQHAIETASVISTDATSAMVQPEAGLKGAHQSCKKGHFFTAIADLDHVLFAYTEKHNHDAVKKLFGDFKGYLQGDASNVYDILERGSLTDDDEGITLVGCWAHCRRYFFEAAICKYPTGVQGLTRIRAIYAAEGALGKVPPARRKQLRDVHIRPLMLSFFEWVKQARAGGQGRNLATKALVYALNQEAELLRVLLDGLLPLDNTRSERSLRKIVVGRKNWMFYGSDSHAESAAALFTLIASCRLHKFDPEQYLDEVLRLLPYWPQDRYLELAPLNWLATRAKLSPAELEQPIAVFTIPAT
jgi:transposase